MVYRKNNREALPPLTTLANPGGVIGKLLAAAKPPITEDVVKDDDRSSPPTAESVLDMSYEEFRRADMALFVRSALLGDDIILASDEAAAERVSGDRVVFLWEEFRRLYVSGELDVDALRALHRLKKGIPGARVTGTAGRGFQSGTEMDD